MKIIIAYSDLKVGGVQHMTTKLANAWAELGHEVVLAIARREPESEFYPLDVRIKQIDFGSDRVRVYLSRLVQLLRDMPEADILYTATTVPNIVAVIARWLAGSKVRLVISERDNPQQGFNALTSAKDKLIWRQKNWAYKAADAVVCVSTPLADALSRYIGISRQRLTVIHNPAAPDSIASYNEEVHPWLSSRRNIPVLVAAGRFHTQKDFPMLVRAFGVLRQSRRARLILLGDGPDRGRIEEAIRAIGLSESVLLPGMQKDIMPWLSQGDGFVMSSLFEGFGNVLVQALAAGCSVVSTDCPDGPSEILAGGRFGILTPVGDELAMARAMATMLDAPKSPDLQRARAAEFSTQAIAGRYIQLFESLR